MQILKILVSNCSNPSSNAIVWGGGQRRFGHNRPGQHSYGNMVT